MEKIYNSLRKLFKKKSPWSIALYESSLNNPFDLKKINKLNYPLLTKDDVKDIKAAFVADPFIVKKDKKIYLFFEIEELESKKGVIGLASANIDDLNFKYEKVVLEEDFHLSYPGVYYIDEKWYMIPESGEANEVRLYTTNNFPYEWKYEKTILKKDSIIDPTLFFHNGYWYIFASKSSNYTLEIYYAKDFKGPYKAHPKNPIYKGREKGRPGGGIFEYKNQLFRFSQNCLERYGKELLMFKIEKLSPNEFKEKFIKRVIGASNDFNWNGLGMHQISFIKDKDRYLIATDGYGYKE